MDNDKEEQLRRLSEEISGCEKCCLARSRTNVVSGSGNPDAKLMFVGEAPGYHEDRQGLPFVGQAGKLLEQLLQRIGLSRGDVFIANVLKCRPPDNRDPQPDEIDICRTFLERQIDIIEPDIVCTMGNFATRLLTGKNEGISRLHGRLQTLAEREKTSIFPVFHPAAALYTRSNLALLEDDFDALATLISSHKHQSEIDTATADTDADVEIGNGEPEPEQLGLF